MLSLQEFVQNRYNKTIAECSNEELYLALLNYSKLASSQKPVNTGKKKVYYISAEFLIGKLLSNNLINLGLYDEVKKELADAGKELIEISSRYQPRTVLLSCVPVYITELAGAKCGLSILSSSGLKAN